MKFRIIVVSSFVVTTFFMLFSIPQANASYSTVNLSLNPTTTVSANQWYTPLNWLPTNAIDGDPDTFWDAGTHATSSNPQWLTVDLGAKYSLHSIVLMCVTPNPYQSIGLNEHYNLYTSGDGGSWDYRGSGTLTSNYDPNDYINTISTNGDAIREIQFVVDGGSSWAHLAELQAWGNPSPVPIPNTLLLLCSGLLLLTGFRKKLKNFLYSL